jgi:hypothetical protein
VNSINQVVLGALIALLCARPAGAELNSARRLHAFAKLPDWSGVWERFNVGPADAPSDPTELAQFIKAFDELSPPYNAEWEAKYQSAVLIHKQSRAAAQASCSALGFPLSMLFPSEMMQAIVTPEETTLIFYTGGARHIATDGRQHPLAEERWATPWGDSVGHWDGETLLVDTVATNAPIIAGYGVPAPFSEQVQVSERIRALDKNTLEDQMTIVDPVALAHPWMLTIRYHHVSNMPHVVDRECAENERNPVVDGKFTVAPPKP